MADAVPDQRQAGLRVEWLLTEAECAASAASGDASRHAEAVAEGCCGIPRRMPAYGFAHFSQAEVEREAFGRLPTRTEADTFALTAFGIAVGTTQCFEVKINARGQRIAEVERCFATAAIQRRGRVVEVRVGCAGEQACIEVLTVMIEFDAPRIAIDLAADTLQRWRSELVDRVGVDLATAARHFGDKAGIDTQLHTGVEAAEVAFSKGITVVNKTAADFEVITQLHLCVGTCNPEGFGALVDFIGYAQRHRVEVGIEGRQELVEEDASGEHLESVVDEADQRTHAENARGLIAVAHHHFDALATLVDGVVAKAVWAATLARKLLDHLTQVVVHREYVAAHAGRIEMPLESGGAAVVEAKAALCHRPLSCTERRHDWLVVAGLEIAVQQVASALVDA